MRFFSNLISHVLFSLMVIPFFIPLFVTPYILTDDKWYNDDCEKEGGKKSSQVEVLRAMKCCYNKIITRFNWVSKWDYLVRKNVSVFVAILCRTIKLFNNSLMSWGRNTLNKEWNNSSHRFYVLHSHLHFIFVVICRWIAIRNNRKISN